MWEYRRKQVEGAQSITSFPELATEPFPVAPPCAGPDSSRTSSDSAVAAGRRAGVPAGQGRSRAGVGAAAGTLGGGASGTAMGVEIETISPGDGTGWRGRGRRRGLGAEPGGGVRFRGGAEGC